LLGCMAAGFTGCNNDIFVERLPDFSKRIELTVNKPCTVAVPFDGLMGVNIACDSDYYTDIVYYDRDGNRLDDFPLISRVARVVYCSPRFTLEAFVNGGDITFCLLDNSYENALPIRVVFDYGHTTACMDIILEPGQPLDTEIFYSLEDAMYNTIQQQSHKTRFTNNGPVTQFVSYRPYGDYRTQVLMSNEMPVFDGMTIECRFPEYTDGLWVMSSAPARLQFNSRVSFIADGTDVELTVEVPPYSTAEVRTTVTFACIKIPFLGYAEQPNSGVSYPFDGSCAVSQPINYTVDVEII
ncbi:MAG: hypothetical protein K2I19_06160, partial [Muribaculaceae bacterium]|nr:hypothetical protein [Muribaculaceae bacterium]